MVSKTYVIKMVDFYNQNETVVWRKEPSQSSSFYSKSVFLHIRIFIPMKACFISFHFIYIISL